MAAFDKNRAILSGVTYTYTGGQKVDDFRHNQYHSFAVSGAGSAVITVDLGEGDFAVATLASGASDVYYYPAAYGFDVTASGGDIQVSMASFECK